MVHELDSGSYIESTKTTVAQWADTWLADYAKHRVKSTTFERYLIYMDKVKEELGNIQLQKLTGPKIQAVYTKWHDQYAPSTIRQFHAVLRMCMEQALMEGLIPRNPCAHVKPPALNESRSRALDMKEVPALLDAAKGSPIRGPILMALLTGLRRGEVLGLRWEDVDLESGVLVVNRQLVLVSNKVELVEPKSRSAHRYITLPTLLVLELRATRKTQSERKLFMGNRWGNEWDLVFAREDGSPINPTYLSVEFKRVVERAGLRPIRFHDLRHTQATLLLAAGENLKVVQERMGHANSNITLDTYTHVVNGAQRATADKLDSMFANAFAEGASR